MKTLFLRLFEILLLTSLALTACEQKAAQTVTETIQPQATSTQSMIAAEVTALPTEDVGLQAIASATPVVILSTVPKVASAAEAEAALTSGVSFLEDLAQEKYDSAEVFAKPGIVTYTVPLARSAPVIWSYAWCAADENMLAANFEDIQLKFLLNDKEIPLDSFAVFETQTGEKVCRIMYTSLNDWPAGETHLVTNATFTSKVNDGSADFEPGDYVLDYKVYVNP